MYLDPQHCLYEQHVPQILYNLSLGEVQAVLILNNVSQTEMVNSLGESVYKILQMSVRRKKYYKNALSTVKISKMSCVEQTAAAIFFVINFLLQYVSVLLARSVFYCPKRKVYMQYFIFHSLLYGNQCNLFQACSRGQDPYPISSLSDRRKKSGMVLQQYFTCCCRESNSVHVGQIGYSCLQCTVVIEGLFIEEKAKVVAASWGTELIQFIAALAILHSEKLKNRMIWTLFFNSFWCNSGSNRPGAKQPILKIVLV